MKRRKPFARRRQALALGFACGLCIFGASGAMPIKWRLVRLWQSGMQRLAAGDQSKPREAGKWCRERKWRTSRESLLREARVGMTASSFRPTRQH